MLIRSSDSLRLRPSYLVEPGERFVHVVFGPISGGKEQDFLYGPEWGPVIPTSVEAHLQPLLLAMGGREPRQPALAFANLSEGQDCLPAGRHVGWLLALPLRQPLPGERPNPVLRYALVGRVAEFGPSVAQLAGCANALLDALQEPTAGATRFEDAYLDFVAAYRRRDEQEVRGLWHRLRRDVEARVAQVPRAEEWLPGSHGQPETAEPRDLQFLNVTLPERHTLAELVRPLAVASAVLCRSPRRWTAVSSSDDPPQGGGLYLRVSDHELPGSAAPPRALAPRALDSEERFTEALDRLPPLRPSVMLPTLAPRPAPVPLVALSPASRDPEPPCAAPAIPAPPPQRVSQWLLHAELLGGLLLLGGILFELRARRLSDTPPEHGPRPPQVAAAALPPDLGGSASEGEKAAAKVPSSGDECKTDREELRTCTIERRNLKDSLQKCSTNLYTEKATCTELRSSCTSKGSDYEQLQKKYAHELEVNKGHEKELTEVRSKYQALCAKHREPSCPKPDETPKSSSKPASGKSDKSGAR